MRRRIWPFVTVVAFVAWIALAIARQQLIASRAARSVGISQHGSFSGRVAPGEPTVSVPLVPLLLNPFTSHPKAYLMQGDLPIGEIQY